MLIHTPRLVIRDYSPADLDDLHEILSDPKVMYFCEAPYTYAQSREMLSYFLEHAIGYAVALEDTGKLIGHLLFHQLPSEEEGIYEIGWFFHQHFWGQGFAFEACQTMLNYGFQELQLHKICAETIDPVRSVFLMEKLGMKREGVFQSHVKDPRGQWADVYWYGICNPMEETLL